MYVTRDFSGGVNAEIMAAEKATIKDVVDHMSEEKLDWAMRQVISTILKNQKKDQETWENAS